MTPSPPFVDPAAAEAALRSRGYAVLDAHGTIELLHASPVDLAAWPAYWNDLPADAYLRDGGRYRRRRHASFVVDGDAVDRVAHRAHWQPLAYNALHGGLERWFAPVEPALAARPGWPAMLRALAVLCSALRGAQRWYVETHQFRIDTTDGIGRPTPEGAHRDGVDLVAVLMVARQGVKGGETRVFDADGPSGTRFTLTEPWSMLLLDDARVIHESTPIRPLDPAPGAAGYRDTLVVTLRANGFQDAAGA